MKHRKYIKDSELSKKIWELKDKGEAYNIKWSIRKVSKSYQPGNSYCKLCLEEVHQILMYSESEQLLNERNKLYKKCRHTTKFKLKAKVKTRSKT